MKLGDLGEGAVYREPGESEFVYVVIDGKKGEICQITHDGGKEDIAWLGKRQMYNADPALEVEELVASVSFAPKNQRLSVVNLV